eukprot:3074757-Karenia_brevis.AAC.1
MASLPLPSCLQCVQQLVQFGWESGWKSDEMAALPLPSDTSHSMFSSSRDTAVVCQLKTKPRANKTPKS